MATWRWSSGTGEDSASSSEIRLRTPDSPSVTAKTTTSSVRSRRRPGGSRTTTPAGGAGRSHARHVSRLITGQG